MKTRKSNTQTETAQQGSGCCEASTIEVKESSEITCCEQPTDGSACCDKNKSKEANIEKTRCC